MNSIWPSRRAGRIIIFGRVAITSSWSISLLCEHLTYRVTHSNTSGNQSHLPNHVTLLRLFFDKPYQLLVHYGTANNTSTSRYCTEISYRDSDHFPTGSPRRWYCIVPYGLQPLSTLLVWPLAYPRIMAYPMSIDDSSLRDAQHGMLSK